MDKPDLLMKAKALAAMEAGLSAKWSMWEFAWMVAVPQAPTPPRYVRGDTQIEALAAAADALGLSPDPAVVVLTEEEKAILNDALCEYQQHARAETESLKRRGYEEAASHWIRTAEQAESLRWRLCE